MARPRVYGLKPAKSISWPSARTRQMTDFRLKTKHLAAARRAVPKAHSKVSGCDRGAMVNTKLQGPVAGAAPQTLRLTWGAIERKVGAMPDPIAVTKPASTVAAKLKRFIPLAVLVAGLVAFFALRLDVYLSLDMLAQHRMSLLAWVSDSGFVAPLVFIGLYAVAIAISVPGGVVFTLAGGFLFGAVLGTAYTVIAATIGAAVVFLAARTALGDVLEKRAGPTLRKMEAGFRENATSYMLLLRLVPLFPFWLVNIVPALLGVPFRIYVITTFVGIIPGTAVYASVGNGLGAFIDAGKMPDLNLILNPEIFLPLVGLGLLSLLPIAYKKFKERRQA